MLAKWFMRSQEYKDLMKKLQLKKVPFSSRLKKISAYITKPKRSFQTSK
jgi:hypothetical protein